MPGAFRLYPIWTVHILWQVHSAKYGLTCRLLSPGTLALPGDLVYCVEGHATGLYRPYAKGSYRTGYGEQWFPPWTVSQEQWTMTLQSSVSGVAVDTLLCNRIGGPLIHRYCVFSRAGTHVAFRGTYMARVQAFIEESDVACL